MADLPKERLIPFEPPFTYTGVDFFGPFHVKRGRSAEKVYGCLFTCFTSRAVHMEDVSSLETDSFIQALRRFISNRGYPKEIWSDNATNLAGAEKEIRQSLRDWNQDELNERLRKDEISCYLWPRIEWKCQPPTASHMSGIWERLIRSVRKTMNAVLGDPNAFVGLETLRTVFAEVVTILNSRPLTPVSDDPSDYEPLTPSHFLLQRWIREYIPTLQQRQKWIREKDNLKIGDVVLVVDNNSPPGRWLLGRVIKTFPGRDGKVRVAEVKTKNSTLTRPISNLCLLEEAV
ncbi:uncharacterized protein [Porites lutea]|uniref:uncharacterized protein n=1 Tax=Porites lutea TaxID=51062 RepID=UPI003CC620FB